MSNWQVTGGVYGPDYRHGVLTDHLGRLVEAGVDLHVTASGRRVAIFEDGSSLPILCSEIVPLYTEDGVVDGRCGRYVRNDDDACPGHQFGIDRWRNASEIERAAIERREEEEALS